MQPATLKTAIQLGQLMTLLAQLAQANKDFDKSLSRLRSGVQEQVIILARSGQEQVQLDSSVRLSRMHDTLSAAVQAYLEVPLLLARYTDPQAKPLHWVNLLTRNLERRKLISRRGLVTILREAAEYPLQPPADFKVLQEDRATITKAYASAVRNADWLALLLRLGLSQTSAHASNRLLIAEHSSHPGRARLAENLRLLCPAYELAPEPGPATRPVCESTIVQPQLSAEGLYNLHTSLDWNKLQAHPVIAALAIPAHGEEPEGYALESLLSLIREIHLVPTTGNPAGQAQERLNAFVADLQLRKTLIEQKQTKLQAQQADGAKIQALAALKQLDPAVLKALQANPELLQGL